MAPTTLLTTFGWVFVLGAILEVRSGQALSKRWSTPWIARAAHPTDFWVTVVCHASVGVFMIVGAIYRTSKGLP